MSDFVLSFDEIRPYYNHEVQEVFQRLLEKPSFFLMMGVLFPELSKEQIMEDISSLRSVEEFQAGYIHETLNRILSLSSKGLSIDGLQNLNPHTPYLFLSNHRDIILDSAFLNVKLHDEGFPTTRIAIGDNLMVSRLITDLMKVNKAFIVHRSVPRQEIMAYSERLSRYIRHSIQEEKSSIWLAQRSGRTKNGKDETATSILKMLAMSGKADRVHSFQELNILPMAISYELEPCDALKAEETYHHQHDIPYDKDDKLAMLTGIRAPKGRIHIQVGQPLKEKLKGLPQTDNKNEWYKALTQLIDREIQGLYKLWPTNYLACDLLQGRRIYANRYSEEERKIFVNTMHERLASVKGDKEELKRLYLNIYAGMVEVKENLNQ